MKRVKFLLVFVFLLVGTLTVLALSNNRNHSNAVITECLKYKGPQPAYSGILNPANWESFFGAPYQYCANGSEICVICFDNFNTTPGEAREILYNYYLTNGYPAHGQTIINLQNGKMVTVYLKEIEER